MAIWTYTAAVSFASFTVASLGGLCSNIYYYRLNDKPLPPITSFLVEFHYWALAIPLPWLFAAAWLGRGDAATQSRVFAYAGISTLAVVFLFTFTAVALTLPFVTIIQSL